MKLIIGLGNPGFRYRNTRHNIGFMVLDRIAKDFCIKIKGKIFAHSLCGKGMIDNKDVMLVKPTTYMNLSGRALGEIIEELDIHLKDLLVIMDDIDLPLGRMRLRPKGSSGGHKGLHSIIEELGSEDFPRLRVGIKAHKKEGDLKDYVLSPFKRTERNTLCDLIERCSLCVKTWISEGIEAAMSRFNPTSRYDM